MAEEEAAAAAAAAAPINGKVKKHVKRVLKRPRRWIYYVEVVVNVKSSSSSST